MIPASSPTSSVTSTRVNSLYIPTASPTLGSCEDLARFPSESLHSFSFAHQSEDLIHNRQNILKRSIEFMRDKLGWGARSPMFASAQARVDGDEDVESMMDLLRKADLVSEEKTPMLTGPATGPSQVDGNPFEQSFANPRSPSPLKHTDAAPITDVNELSSSPTIENFSAETSRSTTIESTSTAKSTPPIPRRVSLKRTYTDTESLALQTKLYDAMSKPYLVTNEPRLPESLIGPRETVRKSSVHAHTNRTAPASQAIFTTESHSPWTILAANDLACLVFGVTKAELKKIGIMEVVREERREWLAAKLNSGENTSNSFPYPHSHHGSPNATGVLLQTGRRAKSDAFYTGAIPPIEGSGLPHHKHSPSRGVVLCGDVVPIQKRNGNTGAASLWVKEKRGGLIWVLEEIAEDVGFVYTVAGENHVERVTKLEGSIKNIFGAQGSLLEGRELSSLVPSLPTKDDGSVDFEETARVHQFTVFNAGGVKIPCGVEPLTPTRGVRVSSFPHIAGIIVLAASNLRITSTNAVFCAALFGHLHPVGVSISEIIPNFDRILDYLRDEENVSLSHGMVVPEHSFRKANAIISLRDGNDDGMMIFSRPGGLIAKHRDGAEIHVDVQMRVVMSETRNSESDPVEGVNGNGGEPKEMVYALWVTYSRHLHIASAASDNTLSQVNRALTPPKQPSPGQPSFKPSLPEPVTPPALASVNKKLEALQMPPSTPPSSDDEVKVPQSQSEKPVLPRGATAPAVMSKRSKTIQDFNILEDMGEGAYGQVKLARYKRNTSKRVVLKYVTKRRILVDTWTRDRRLGTVPLEIHVLDYLRRDGLKHPNIVEMTDFFEDDINYYIEMVPHGLPGMDLFDYIELKMNMDEDECRSIFVQVARALHHLHIKAGVVHRDIKDENVVLDGEGNIKLIDFGSAAYIKNGPFDVFVGTIGKFVS